MIAHNSETAREILGGLNEVQNKLIDLRLKCKSRVCLYSACSNSKREDVDSHHFNMNEIW